MWEGFFLVWGFADRPRRAEETLEGQGEVFFEFGGRGSDAAIGSSEDHPGDAEDLKEVAQPSSGAAGEDGVVPWEFPLGTPVLLDDRGATIEGDGHDLKSFVPIRAVQAMQERELGDTGSAPGRPKDEEGVASTQTTSGQGSSRAVEEREHEGGHRLCMGVAPPQLPTHLLQPTLPKPRHGGVLMCEGLHGLCMGPGETQVNAAFG